MTRTLSLVTTISIMIIILSFTPTFESAEAYGDDEQAWSADEWKVTGPDTIIGGPSLSDGEDSMYLSGGNGGRYRLYEIVPEHGFPSTTFEFLEGRPTSSPQVYPDKGYTTSAYQYWKERAYVGDENGMLYRVDKTGDDLDTSWTLNLSEDLGRWVSITHTPIIAERKEKNDLLVIVTTEDSVHAVKDDKEGGTPRLIWNQSFETFEEYFGIINQPDIFKNVRDQEEMETDKVIIVTTSMGLTFTLDYMTGSVIWSDDLSEYVGTADKISEPVIPFGVKKGDVNEQYFYVILDDFLAAVHLHPIINEDVVDLIDINADSGNDLTIPEISPNGNMIWLSSYGTYDSTIYQLTVESDEYGYDWNVDWRHTLNESVKCRPAYNKRNELIYAVSQEGTMYCINTWGEGLSDYGERVYWDHHIGGKPESIHLLPVSVNRNFLTPVVMIIHEDSFGGAEGWKAVKGGTAPYYDLDPFLFGDTIISLCFWCFLIVWLVTISITFALYVRRKKSEKKPSWPPDYIPPK
ncbi:MAG: hypothetical protein R6U61_08445 [Thermoplasmata archaeon]